MIYLHRDSDEMTWVVVDVETMSYINGYTASSLVGACDWYKTSEKDYKVFCARKDFYLFAKFENIDEFKEYVINEYAEELI